MRNPLTPQPGDLAQSQPSAEDSFLDLLVETLEGVEESVRGQFLRSFFRTMAQVDLAEAESAEYWDRILIRRRELSENLGKPVSLKTAIVDVLASASLLRVPILVEYDEFKKLQINAATDALTGLYNRRLFDEYCDKELNRAKRYAQQLAIVILDLHKLKEVNDQRGHLQGDEVLQIAAATLRKTLRASDFSFRIGGDEFALLLPQTDPEQAITLCHRIRSQYETDIVSLRLDIGVTLDFGVAVHPVDGDQKSALMNIADQRLYQMKISGRAKSGERSPETPAAPQRTAEPQASRETQTNSGAGAAGHAGPTNCAASFDCNFGFDAHRYEATAAIAASTCKSRAKRTPQMGTRVAGRYQGLRDSYRRFAKNRDCDRPKLRRRSANDGEAGRDSCAIQCRAACSDSAARTSGAAQGLHTTARRWPLPGRLLLRFVI